MFQGPRSRWLARHLAPTLLLCLATDLLAQTPGSEPTTEERLRALEERIRAQDETIRLQDQRLEGLSGRVVEPDPAKVQAAVDTYLEAKREKGELGRVLAGWDKNFYLKSEDDKFRLEIGGYADFDYRAYQREYAADDTFLVREIKPEIRGHLWKDYQFRLQLELSGASVRLQDAWINFRHIEEAQLKIGQFKEPFGLDQLTGLEYHDFVERPIVSDFLTPSRDVGVMLHGKPFGGVVEYAAGFFNGEGLNRTDANDDKDVAARIVLAPFRKSGGYWTKGLQVGGNVTSGEQQRPFGGRVFQTAGDTTFLTLDPRLTHDENLLRLGADFAWLVGPASVKGEWVRNSLDDLQLRRGVTEDFEAEGFWVSGTYLLTGEEKTFKNVIPKTNFDPREGGWGAWELAGRYEYFDVNANILENRFATGTENVWALTGGVNWYLNPNVRASVNYEYSRFEENVTLGGQPEADEHLVAVRVQFLF